ncbi:MAG: InlB B-repeat-containing protein, partial [Clostridia bacterium]
MKTKNTKVETPRNKKANHKSSIKYVFLIALVVCMVFCLFACGESDTQFVDDGTFTVNLYDGDTVLGSYKTPKNTVVASAPTAEPEKSGYIFDGWFFDKELTAPVVYPLTVSKNSDFYAKFSPSCVITYYGENNQLIKEIAVVRGELAVFPTDEEILAVTPVGSHFAKWNIAKFNTDQKFLTVTAVFEKNEYKINFVIGKDSYHTISAKFGDAIGAMPADPLWGEGEDVAYTFAYWSETADGTPFDFSALNNKMPSHDITLHACWTENRFAVKFFDGDLEMPSLSMTYGASDIKNFRFPTTEKLGFEFAGWFDNKALTGEAVTALAENAVGDKTFWAKFEIKDITLDVKTDAVNNAITFGDNITLSCEHQKLDGFTYSYSWFLGELTAKPSGSVALSTTETLFLLRPTVLDEYRYTVFVEVKSPIAETSAMFATISFSVNAQKIEIADSDLNWSGVYDGKNHGIDTSKIPAKYLEGGTVLYSLDEINFTATAPEFKDASVAPYQVFFRVENPNFETYDGVSTVTITKKDVSVSYTGLSKNYDGQAFSASLLDGLTVINGLVDGDTVTAGEIATYGINAGQYSTKDFAFTVPFAINGDSEMTNYQVVFEFSASIGKNQLTVSALQSVTYGAELNSWTYSYVGFIDGENQQLVVGAPNVLGVDYEKGNATGFKNYSIDISQLSAENYVFVDGIATLQIEKAEVKIVGSQSVTYGSALGDWTFEFEGLLFGQSAISLKIEPTVADTNYTVTTPVGVYKNGKITCLDTENYTFVGTIATLTVIKATPQFTAPAGIIATLNMTTDDLSLPLGFSFDSKTAFDTIGEKIVTVTFTPTDTINFE